MNKNLIKILTVSLFLVSIFLLTIFDNIEAYNDKTTHPDLTREIVSFYELSTGKNFTDEQKHWIIQGSIDEDLTPRWLNHFYDPVYERGLYTAVPMTNGYSAKNWAQYSSYQTINTFNIGNLWSGNGPVVSGSWWGDFSYEAAIKNYSKSKEKDAYLTLGHILHIIEDMTVPEHTRNDSHPGGSLSSYYENWTKNNSSGLTQDLGKRIFSQGNRPIIYYDLESYFNNLAKYTSEHFFSPRTINSDIYQKPKIVFEDGTFAYGRDENNELFDLAYLEKDFITKKANYSISKNQILQEYWLRLSRQAIVNGAGVIQLFLNQAEAARKVELAKQKVDENQNNSGLSFLSKIFNFFSSPEAPAGEPALVINSNSAGAPSRIIKPETVKNIAVPNKKNTAPAPAPILARTPVSSPMPTPVSTLTPAPAPVMQQNTTLTVNRTGVGPASPDTTNGGGGTSISNSNNAAQTQSPAVSTNQTGSTQTDFAQFATGGSSSLSQADATQTFSSGDLIINEIMYDLEGADTLNNKSREWVELFNKSGHEITLTGGNNGWRFSDGSNHFLNEPAAHGSMAIPIGSYAVLAGDAAIFLADHSGFNGTVIDTAMSLKNSTSTVKIIAPNGVVIDEVAYSNSWGANGNGKTLERKSATGNSNDAVNWAQSSVLGGTPGAANNWELSTSSVDSNASTTVAFDDTAASNVSTVGTATSTGSLSLIGLGTNISANTIISENITWTLAGSPYRLFFDGTRRPTVAADAILTIEPGVKIIPQSGNYTALEIKGTLNAIATSGAPIIFTSMADADNDDSTVPQKGDWLNIAFSQGSRGNFQYVEFHYGGQGSERPVEEMIKAIGAIININHSIFTDSQSIALRLVDSNGIIENSTFSDNACGISVDSLVNGDGTISGGCAGSSGYFPAVAETAPQIKNNQFIRNRLIAIETRNGATPIIDSNIFTDNGYPVKIESSYPTITNSEIANSISFQSNSGPGQTIINGIIIDDHTHFRKNFTLKKDLPYILEASGGYSPYIDVGATLTIESGVIFKVNHTYTALNINGNLIASTTPNDPIFFTSIKDDLRGGDTNNDGSASFPQNNDWSNIRFSIGSTGNLTNVSLDYGGYGYVLPVPLPPILLNDFSTISLSWSNSEKISSSWVANKNGSFGKVIFHNFSASNPNGYSYSFGIKKESDNNFVASTTINNLKDIVSQIDLNVPIFGGFISGEKYYAIIKIIPPEGTMLTDFDFFGIGKDANQNAATAFYESAPQPYSNPALSIDSGSIVIVRNY